MKITMCGVDTFDFPKVQGTVVNTSDHKATVKVGFDITGADGTRIDAAQGRAEDLKPGQRGRFTAITLATTVKDGQKITCTLADVEIE